ncbi:MAG: EVE domain-containing protein [Gemmataceae bacterium]|nr:EVE domain-containing protein [Gemmataceae bacterium]MCS7271056.1 EVE domain-containing protein [Gemmataceae bacterium]MDW8244059.1 EVE domain-containing protein [Thermogemmata sp.]
MAVWLFKSEPSEYSYADLERDGETVWDGVSNPLALQHLAQVRRGDQIYFYHTGKEKAVVGIMEAVADAMVDPNDPAGKLWVVRVRPVRRLSQPIPLTRFKAEPRCAQWELVRLPRLAVMPVPADIVQLLQGWEASSM